MYRDYKISIAMCTYNGEKYIKEQLYSIFNQTIKPDEIIICDDCSKDKTVEIINYFKDKLNIKLYNNDCNLGVTKNFEKAIKNCNGDIIFLSDQDDYWNEKKIEKIVEKFELQKDICMIFTNADVVDKNLKSFNYNLWDSVNFNKRHKNRILDNHAFEMLLNKNYITGATMAFKKELKNVIFPIPNEFIHDEWIALMACIFYKINFLDEKLILYRIHENNVIGTSNNQIKKSIKNCKIINRKNGCINKIKKCNAILKVINNNKKNNEYYNREINNMIKFYSFRFKLLNNPINRIFSINKEVFNGNYFKYGNGIHTIIRDIFFFS